MQFHLGFGVKYNGRHKVHLIADKNIAEVSLSSTHPGVVSLKGIELVISPDELNQLVSWGTCAGNSYR